MRLYWLSVVPLVAAAIISIGRRQRVLAVGLSLATTLACASLALLLPLNDVTFFLGQQWVLNQVAQTLLVFMYIATAILLTIEATTEQGESFCAPVLASVGLLSAVILLRSLLLSFLLLPASMAVLVLATPPLAISAIRGAARFLTWVTLPTLFVLAAFMLLERFALFPDELALANLSAWLMVPPVTLWLTLFPFHGTTRLWATDGLSLAPVFLWVVKDWIVIYLLLALWEQNPVLHMENAMITLGIAGLVTAVVSGVLALAQSSPSAVLACAAMSELGIAVQGMTADTGGLQGGLFLLVSRSVAVLLASSALAAMYSTSVKDSKSNAKSFHWQSLALLIAFIVGVLSMAGIPPLGGFFGRRYIYALLQAKKPYLFLAWLSASMGIVLGLVRTSWSLWHMRVQSTSGHIRDFPLFLVLCLLLLCLWIGFRPQAALGLISALFGHWLPLSPL